MSNLKYLTLAVVASALLLPLGIVSAQTADEDPMLYDTTSEYDYGYDSDYDYDYYYDWDSFDSGLTEDEAAAVASAGIFGLLFAGVGLVISLVVGIVFYVYGAITLKKTAEILGYKDTWMAWVPIANIVLIMRLGDMNPWLILLLLVPVLGTLAFAVVTYIAMANIAQKRDYDKLLVLINLIPGGTFVFWGLMAWGKKNTPVATQPATPVATPTA
jgi:hypothetical protein